MSTKRYLVFFALMLANLAVCLTIGSNMVFDLYPPWIDDHVRTPVFVLTTANCFTFFYVIMVDNRNE